jgi:hypothetical protein
MIKLSTRLAFLALFFVGLSSEIHAQCDPRDPECERRINEDQTKTGGSSRTGDSDYESNKSLDGSRPTVRDYYRQRHDEGYREGEHYEYRRNGEISGSGSSEPATGIGAGPRPLQPVRAYMRAKDIPPAGSGAYGLVVFHARPTPASRAKLVMVCRSFVAFFPRNETASVPLTDQMITIWPLDNPDAKKAKTDDCDYVLDHYDLIASEAAIRDAQKQHAKFEGEGPYLVGWSPSNAREIPDALVLVVDMSADNTQADIDNKFRFWKNNIVEDPSVWRNGWSVEGTRVAIHNFADHYGQAMLDAIKLIGDEKKP